MSSRFHTAWEKIFEEKSIDLSLDIHPITAKEIKEMTGEEPRLMAKFDSTNNVPEVFKRSGYFLLPTSSSAYVIVRGNGFHPLEPRSEIENFESRIPFNLTTMHRNTSEMQYLDYSTLSGVIEDVVDRGKLYQSIRGREGSGSFDFQVNKSEISVRSAQIEVDLGLEGEDCIVLFEGKSSIPDDFIIRQLYYPYRRFLNLTPEKTIIPIFFSFESKTQSYNYWIYRFDQTNDYNSIKLVSTRSLRISNVNTIKPEDIYPEYAIYKDIIPQANDLDKVIELVFKAKEGFDNAADIAAYFKFDPRQSSYYREAAEALGFVKLEKNKYILSDSGLHLTKLDRQERSLFVARTLNNFKLVKESLSLLKSKGNLTRQDLDKIVESNSSLSGTTIPRRASSLFSWLKWIAVNTGVFELTDNGQELKLFSDNVFNNQK